MNLPFKEGDASSLVICGSSLRRLRASRNRTAINEDGIEPISFLSLASAGLFRATRPSGLRLEKEVEGLKVLRTKCKQSQDQFRSWHFSSYVEHLIAVLCSDLSVPVKHVHEEPQE